MATTASLADLTAGTRQTIGRYFSIVSMAPSVLLVIFIFLLIRSGAWYHDPDWTAAVRALIHARIGEIAVLTLVGVAVGFAVHPLQFSIVQFFEGFWGASGFAEVARAARIKHHRNRADALDERATEGDEEADRLSRSYPDDPTLIMPTRLGNVLRRYEILVGRQYDLKVLVVLPHVALVAEDQDVRYLDDQRAQLDLTVRLSFTALVACVISVLFLWHDGPWLFVALAPLCFAYLAYRGAVITAHEFGMSMTTLIDLNRFALYERFHLPLPDDIEEERNVNRRLIQIIEANSNKIPMDYEHSTSGP